MKYIDFFGLSIHHLTCLHSTRCLLRAELLWKRFRFFLPLWTSFHLLWTAFAIESRAVLKGEDVLYEEGSQRFDGVRHFHPVIHKSEASQCQRAAAGVEAVCLLTHCLNLYKEQGRVYSNCTDKWRRAKCSQLSTFRNFHLFASSDQPDGNFWYQTTVMSYQKEVI